MNHNANTLRPARLLGGLTLGLVMAFAAAPVAQADSGTPPAPGGAGHFFDCLSALFSDPAMHAQYCGGNTIPANNTGLSIPFSSPGACASVGSLTWPVAGGLEVASLDDSGLVAPSPFGPTMLVATPGGCCISMLTAPSFPTTHFASLDGIGSEVRDLLTNPPAGTTEKVAGSCCISMLTAPAFGTVHVASLEGLGTELSGLSKDQLLVARC